MKKASRTSRKSVNTKKTASRNRSRAKTDAINAFKLVCALIIVSICVSFAIIMVWTGDRGQGTEDREILTSREQILSVPIDVQDVPTPKIVIQEEKPAQKSEPVPKPEPTVFTSVPASTTTPAHTTTTANTSAKTTTATTTRTAEHKGSIAFVIDDAGNNLKELDAFLRIDGPLTIAVLPGLPHSAEAAKRIRAVGKEVILHQPMEAVGGQNPGPSAIYSNMSAEQIRAVLKKNIEEVGPVVGINNHQGSKITMDREIMEVILAFCAENKLYFLDSRTTAETSVPAAARRLGMKIAERDTFLDNEQDKESMQRYLTSGLARAQRNGSAVMIGHTHSPALAPLLAEQYPVLTIQGYTIKTVSDILK